MNDIQGQVSSLLNKEMDRLTFLKHVGIGFVAMTGVGALVKSMNSFGGSVGVKQQATGYGASAYGGNKVSR